ncbi:hypothetical protein L1887_29533 [Cichorium endivia]|nr:hypothetical protein L1887_29533 [Cichorium endivia]
MYLTLAFQPKFYLMDFTNFISMKSVTNYTKNSPNHPFLHSTFEKVKEGANSQKFYASMTLQSWTTQNNMKAVPFYHYLLSIIFSVFVKVGLLVATIKMSFCFIVKEVVGLF